MKSFIKTLNLFLILSLTILVFTAYIFVSKDAISDRIFLDKIALLGVFLTIISFLSSYYITQSNIKVYKHLEKIIYEIRYNKEPEFPKLNDRLFSRIFYGIKEIYKLLLSRQEWIEKEKERLSSIISSMNEGLILLNKNADIELLNPQASIIFNCTLKKGGNFFEQCSQYNILNVFEEILKNDITTKEVKHNHRYLVIKIQNLRNSKLILISDITEQKKYDEMKTQFFEDASHELKTPTTSILGYAETLINNPNIDKSLRDKFLNYIYINAESLNVLIEDLLTLHRLETDRHIKKGTCNLKEIENELKIAFLSETESKHLEFIVNCEDLEIDIASGYIKSILWNLVDNAVKYTDDGSIEVKCFQKENILTLIVEDTGMGIDERYKKRIFERFYTTQKNRDKRLSGTGLGLSIVKHIVQLYNGCIDIESTVGLGSKFEIKLYL